MNEEITKALDTWFTSTNSLMHLLLNSIDVETFNQFKAKDAEIKRLRKREERLSALLKETHDVLDFLDKKKYRLCECDPEVGHFECHHCNSLRIIRETLREGDA